MESLGDHEKRCTNYVCNRNFTPEEKKIAYMLYGKDCILSVCNFKTKNCGYINENTKS